ncbi:MAG: hypothetical protein HYZ14_09585 [Bacteroidetes bacterium]|nr:hypothetical protein [Bacteroidota bacterium]
MDAILDYIVSETWAFMTVFTFLCLVPTLMIMRRPFKNLVLARVTQISVSLLAFCGLMYMVMSDHGYAGHFIGGLTNGSELCLVEEHYQGDGDGGSWEAYRLYVLDLKTGALKYRMNIESPEILGMSEKSVFFFEWTGAVEYSLEDGSKTGERSKEKGFEKFPELKGGIMDLNRSSEAYQFKNEAWLTITAKDGHFYCYNLLTDELVAQQYPPDRYTGGFKLDEYELRYTDPADTKSWCFNFETSTGEIERLVFHDKNYEVLNFEGEFLDPEIVAYNAKNRLFVIRHYETLERTHALFSAVSFDLKPLWRQEQRKFAGADKVTPDPLPGIAFASEDKLITTFGGTVVCLNILDGTVIWKVSL